MKSNPTAAETWAAVQAECADLPGTAGIEERRKRYAPFFLRMGKDVVIEEGCRFYHPDRIVLDDDARINIGALVYGSGGLWIGRHARIGPRFFVHSANHDIEDGPTAFFERGYEYLPTVIGDNVLISANVSIMPGAVLGNSVFVAAGTVVPAGTYQQRTRLFGVPASEKTPASDIESKEAPEIAFFVPDTGHWKDAVLHLLSTLGLPQVSVFAQAEELPASLHTIIQYGPPGWEPSLPADVECWKLEAQEKKLSAEPIWFNAPSGVRISLPERVETSVVADGREGEDPQVRGLEQALYWLTTRLAKGAGPISHDEKGEWKAALRVLKLKHGRADRLRERIEELIQKRRPRKTVVEESRATLGERAEMVLAAAKRTKDRDALRTLVAQRLSAARNAADLIACGIAATMLDDAATVDQIRDRLADKEWRKPGVAMPRSSKGSSGFCYSPLVLGWLFLEARRNDGDFELPQDIGQPRRLVRPLHWSTVGSDGALVHEESRTLSRSLIDNWLALHETPCPDGSQVLLEDFNYGQSTAPLEQAWREIFLFLQGRKRRPLVRVHPWPGGRKAAVSLRYDVDRPVGSQTIEAIVRGQMAAVGGPCGSWYFFGGEAASEGQARQLAWYWQESAIHVEDPDADPVARLGVTHHSAPTSMYWRGDRTNAALDERGADYCEFLNVQTGFPRPAWIRGADASGRLGTSWTTPIHFPLEGSTSDVDLSYFDRRLDRFRDLVAAGGHCIIATHPDLNQDLMDQLLAREKTGDMWFATVGAVVKRCRHVLSHGAIGCALDPTGGIALVSRESLADVRVEVRTFGSDDVKSFDVQLEAGRPRLLDGPKQGIPDD